MSTDVAVSWLKRRQLCEQVGTKHGTERPLDGKSINPPSVRDNFNDNPTSEVAITDMAHWGADFMCSTLNERIQPGDIGHASAGAEQGAEACVPAIDEERAGMPPDFHSLRLLAVLVAPHVPPSSPLGDVLLPLFGRIFVDEGCCQHGGLGIR